ncbi:hypothetical protein V8C86DRAFT_270905 [Haematococcus lacustris]
MQVIRSSAAPTRIHNHPLIFPAPHPRVRPSHPRTRHLRCRLRVVSGLFGNATAQQPAPAASEGSGAWYKRGADLWVSVHSVAEFEQEVLKADKLVCVDWYAPWCASCQRSYPEVCNVISCNPDLRSAFKFVKVCIDDLPKSFRVARRECRPCPACRSTARVRAGCWCWTSPSQRSSTCARTWRWWPPTLTPR